MTLRQLLALPLAHCLVVCSVFAEEVEKVDICELLRSVEDYAGRFIQTTDFLVPGKGGEWFIGLGCGEGYMLVVTPDEVTPHPGFRLSEDTDRTFLVDDRIRRIPGFLMGAAFEGRIDWVGVDLPLFPLKSIRKIRGRVDWKRFRTKTGEAFSPKDLFGKSKIPVRLVLRRMSDVVLRDILSGEPFDPSQGHRPAADMKTERPQDLPRN